MFASREETCLLSSKNARICAWVTISTTCTFLFCSLCYYLVSGKEKEEPADNIFGTVSQRKQRQAKEISRSSMEIELGMAQG